MNLRKAVKEIIESYLKSNSLLYFIGGSERFGWTTIRSDIDFFINATQADILIMLKNFPVVIKRNENIGLYENCGDLQYSVLGGLVHLNFFADSIQIFNLLKIEHVEVEKILQKNIELRQVVRTLKISNAVSGKDIYKALKVLVY